MALVDQERGALTHGPVARPPPDGAFQRKDAILSAACSHFGRYGFRGASLRDIARDAGVSLTLLNHHFDNKAGLLSAVIEAHRPMLRRRALAIRQLRSNGLGAFEPADLVRTWITIVLETAVERDGRRFLRLLGALRADASEEALAVRGRLKEGAEAFIDALQHCYPDSSRRAATSAYLCADAAILDVVTNDALLADSPKALPLEAGVDDRAWLERFLVAGIDAALSRQGA